MSVIVNGMEMPKNCRECPMVHREFDGYETRLDCYMIQDWCPEDEGVHPDCPLIALPETHGRLVDADALEPDADYDDGDYWAYSVAQVCNAPTIVEKES